MQRVHEENDLFKELTIEHQYEDYSILLEELELSHRYAKAYFLLFDEKELYRIPTDLYVSVGQHFGHIAYTQKLIGKRINMNFSFKLDNYDELFFSVIRQGNKEELPNRGKLLEYFEDIHDSFKSELKYSKFLPALVVITNHNYVHSSFMRDIAVRYGYDEPKVKLSKRIQKKSDDGKYDYFYLPPLTN